MVCTKNYSPVIVDLTSGYRRAKDSTHIFYEVLGYHNSGEIAKYIFKKRVMKNESVKNIRLTTATVADYDYPLIQNMARFFLYI